MIAAIITVTGQSLNTARLFCTILSTRDAIITITSGVIPAITKSIAARSAGSVIAVTDDAVIMRNIAHGIDDQ
jgi:hypothetical protein